MWISKKEYFDILQRNTNLSEELVRREVELHRKAEENRRLEMIVLDLRGKIDSLTPRQEPNEYIVNVAGREKKIIAHSYYSGGGWVRFNLDGALVAEIQASQIISIEFAQKKGKK